MTFLSMPAALLLLGSAIYLFISRRGKNGSAEMGIGSILLTISILGNFAIYYYQKNNQFNFEKHQETLYTVSDFITLLMPIGLLLFAVGFARFSNFIAYIRGRKSV